MSSTNASEMPPPKKLPKKTKALPKRPPLELTPRPAEQLLIDILPELEGERYLCTSTGRAQFAAAAVDMFPQATASCLFLDLYHAQRAQELHAALAPRLSIVCQPDFPEEPVDVAVLPTFSRGEAELTRELLQQAYERLAIGGRMATSVDNPTDRWLHEEMRALFEKVTRRPEKHGTVYVATKSRELKKRKNFDCELKFRDRGQLISMVTRPGVFSHRRLDLGARSLMNSFEVSPGDHVVDLGCGAGGLSFAAALRESDVIVTAVDSNPRAIQCVERGAALNGVTDRVSAMLALDADIRLSERCDLVLANPPYFSDYRIASLFLLAAVKMLRKKGRLQLVTKTPEWFEEAMPQMFDDLTALPAGNGYFVFSGVRRPDSELPRIRIAPRGR